MWPSPIVLPPETVLSGVSESEWLALLSEKILANLVVGVVVQRPDGEIISANEAACKILSLTMEQLCGRSSFDPSWRAVDAEGEFLPGERHPAMVTIESLQASQSVMGIYSGSELATWIHAYATPIMDSDMNLVGVSTSFVNITELRLALDREAETKRFYERLSSEASDTVLTVGTNGEVLTASASSEALFGLPMESILGSALESILPATAADTVRTLFNNVSAVPSSSGRVVVQIDSPVVGFRAYDLSLKNLMNDPDSQFLVCTFSDVDQLFNLQSELAEANAELSRTVVELERSASIDYYLAEALEMLIRCQSLTEVGEVIWDCLSRVFVDSNLALYLVESDGTELRLFRQAGSEFEHISVLAEKCWGIRTRHVHLNAHNGVRCEHYVPEGCSVCVPFFFESQLVAWAQIERDGEDCEALEKAADKIFRRLLHSIPPETLGQVLSA